MSGLAGSASGVPLDGQGEPMAGELDGLGHPVAIGHAAQHEPVAQAIKRLMVMRRHAVRGLPRRPGGE